MLTKTQIKINRIKHIAFTIFLFSAIAIGVWKMPSEIQHCQTVVLNDLRQHEQFKIQLSNYAETTDFLTTLTRGK